MATTSIQRIGGITASRASWVPMIVVATAQVLVIFNIAAVKVSIDGIATSLEAPANTVKAAMVAYLLVIAAFIMLGARVRQKLGVRRVFRTMLALFAAAMTIMVFSRGAAGMLAAQLVAGIAAAMLIPALAPLLTGSYRDAQQAKALARLAGVRATTIVPAFLIAGAMASWASWRVTFALLAVCAAAACALGGNLAAVQSDAALRTVGIDKTGVVLVTLAILLLGVGANGMADWGVLRATPAAPFGPFNVSPAPIAIVAGILFVCAFWSWERRCSIGGRTPLVSPDLMRGPHQWSALIAMLTIGAIGSAITFLVPLYIEVIQGRTSVYTATALLPYTLATFAAAILIVRWHGRLDARTVTRYGFFAVAAGVALLASTIRNDWSDSLVILGMLLAGLGEGALAALLSKVLVTAAPAHLADDVDCLCGCTGYLGAGVGMALAGALVITILGASVHRDLDGNPLLPDELKRELNLDRGVSFVSNDRLQAVLARTTATPGQVAEAVRINTEARLRALKISLFFLAGLALLASVRAAGVQDTPGQAGTPTPAVAAGCPLMALPAGRGTRVDVPALDGRASQTGRNQGTSRTRAITPASAPLLGAPSPWGSLLALPFWWQSLTPTLIPRTWEMQAMIGAACLAIGYALGTLLGHCVHVLLAKKHRGPVVAIRRGARITLGTAWLAGLILGGAQWTGWQNEQRDFMGMTATVFVDAGQMAALSMAAGVLLVVIGRMLARGYCAFSRLARACVPSPVPVAIVALVIVATGFFLGRGIVFRFAAALAEWHYAPLNEQTSPGTHPPDSARVSGSAASFVAWNTLGRQGRDFVASVTTAHEMRTFHGLEARLSEPVRVYVGVRSAASAEERARLAVRELERAGGFERRVLVVWIPTGSGWVIPEAAAALEQLHRGDTAIVAIQYSFLPSLLGVFLDAGLANDAGRALFGAVHERWSELPPGRRPKLILFGKSLGTAGVEAPFVGDDAAESVANLVARTDGALIVGPKHGNPIHAQLTRERAPSSPAWQPVFGNGRSARFLTRDPRQVPLRSGWHMPRIAWLQHPSDPVTFWSVDVLWRRPDWMDEPRGYDVPNELRWFPIVSGVQAVGDLLAQLSTPPGFGHVYTTDYVRGWISVVPPDAWKESDTERLKRLVGGMAGGESEQ